VGIGLGVNVWGGGGGCCGRSGARLRVVVEALCRMWCFIAFFDREAALRIIVEDSIVCV